MPPTKETILKEYEEKCGVFTLECEKDDAKTYICTERFRAESLLSREMITSGAPQEFEFLNLEEQIRNLFAVTFSDKDVMAKYATGNVQTKAAFVTLVKNQSLRWHHKYQFAAFIIEDQQNDHEKVGYEIIGNSDTPGIGETAYLFNKHYYKGNEKAGKGYVGYENVGALILGYGEHLYKKGALVNQSYNARESKFAGGKPFTKIAATARIDNIGSVKILEKLGFTEVCRTHKYGHEKHEFQLNYQDYKAEKSEIGSLPFELQCEQIALDADLLGIGANSAHALQENPTQPASSCTAS
jgi:Acetyltransferase (GNAT) domain